MLTNSFLYTTIFSIHKKERDTTMTAFYSYCIGGNWQKWAKNGDYSSEFGVDKLCILSSAFVVLIIWSLNRPIHLYSIFEKSSSKNWIFKSISELIFPTFPACFCIPIFFSNLNYNCSNLLDLRNLQEQVKKEFCNKTLHCRLELSLRKTWGYALESMGDWN